MYLKLQRSNYRGPEYKVSKYKKASNHFDAFLIWILYQLV
ncbi:hypothetical protein THF1D04_10674 [Vibrio owensii]|uniref:Uncharacterized protein n=1 Tax=Vibrio owensii TaxID=696485 RepID=A0AAU9PZC7_9VIBR|nr:hypothetical protein THF1D04_10674 [Vibrio owensii]